MHVETVGYISLNKEDKYKILDYIQKHQLAQYDSHESEIITDVDESFVKELTGSVITKNDAQKLLNQCQVIKFYF